MLEKPDLPDQAIIERVQDSYGIKVARLAFLALGADVNTAVYRVLAADETDYFLKLRKGAFDEVTVTVPCFLSAQGNPSIIAPVATRTGRPWASQDTYALILYPFVAGRDGYQVPLSERQWIDFGVALKQIHMAQLPAALARLVQHEDFASHWREAVRNFQQQIDVTTFGDPVAAQVAILLQARRPEINHMLDRADQLGRRLQSQAHKLVLCHSDLHAGNLLISAAGALYIVDWDNPSFAPKERDLMHIGAGSVEAWNSARAGELFYQGYGPAAVDPIAVTYYRYERIIEDIAAFCEELLSTVEGGADRERSYGYLSRQFLPGHEVDAAIKADASALNHV